MENRRALPTRRDLFLDERGAGLRVTWHPERDLVVLSVWQEDSCVGTFRMPVQDLPRLAGLLTAALGDWVARTSGGSVPAGLGPAGLGPAGPVPAGSGPADPGSVAAAGWGSTGGGSSLSVRRRVRLSRAVLRLRALQQRRRRSA